MPIPFRVASFAWRNPAECKSKVTTLRSCPTARSFLPGAALQALRPGTRWSNFCLNLAALGPLCGCVTIICLLRALMRTIGNGLLAACRSSRPLPKGAIQADFASAVRDDSGVRSRRGGIDHVVADGRGLFRLACEHDIEGIVGKPLRTIARTSWSG